MKKRVIAIALALGIVLGLWGMQPTTAVSAETNTLTVMSVDGSEKEIDFVNPEFSFSGGEVPFRDSISLFTEGNRPYVNDNSINTNVAVVVGADGVVTAVINKSVNGGKPAFNEATDVTVPVGGYVLLACDSSYATAGYKSFLATGFKEGDKVTLCKNGEAVSLEEAIAGFENVPEAEQTAVEVSYRLDRLVVEAAFDPDFESVGAQKEITFVNPDFSGPVTFENSISLFTYGNRPFVSEGTIKTNVAVVVNKEMVVTQVLNPSINGAKPSFADSTDVEVPEGGFVLLGCDNSYATAGFKSFLATEFSVGDKIKLLVDGRDITVDKLLSLVGQKETAEKTPGLSLDNGAYATITESFVNISGTVTNLAAGSNYMVCVENSEPGKKLSGEVKADGSFSVEMPLETGANYLDIYVLLEDCRVEESLQSIIVYRAVESGEEKPVILWIDQYASAKGLNSVDKINKLVETAKEAGITAFAFDVKGCEGYVSFKKNSNSNAPYMTETKNPNKAVDMEIDFLEEMLKAAHANGIRLYASMNYFCEGNLNTKDSAINIFGEHSDWAEVLQTPEDRGELKSVLTSAKNSTLVYVNPANREVRDYELSLTRDILENYAVDGIVVDRGRYDNLYADFSDESKKQFSEFLEEQGKVLEQWPADAFRIREDGSMETGKYYYEWLSYRSSVIASFIGELRECINIYEKKQNREIILATYVGAWYESLYQNGVNWAAESFEYNDRLEFPNAGLYGEEYDYAAASYVKDIDFIMTGCYYTTTELMDKYTTLSNILINEEIPVYASIDLTTLTEADAQRVIFQNAYNNTDGSMIFDLCYVDWNKLSCAIADTEYVNDTLIRVYNKASDEVISVDLINTTRAEDTIVIYTDEHGDTTGTNQWGVEFAVDADGKVIETKNRMQAIEWNWAVPEVNNTAIPKGGFVLSAADGSGSRVYRQLLANALNVGDEVSAVLLRGYFEETKEVYESAEAELTFEAFSFLDSDKLKVCVNGAAVTAGEENTYTASLKLKAGENKVIISVYVEDAAVVEKEIILIGSDSIKTSEPVVHTVVRGDTLWRLAKEYGTTVEAIVKLNNIKNPDLIIIGQELIIFVE